MSFFYLILSFAMFFLFLKVKFYQSYLTFHVVVKNIFTTFNCIRNKHRKFNLLKDLLINPNLPVFIFAIINKAEMFLATNYKK